MSGTDAASSADRPQRVHLTRAQQAQIYLAIALGTFAVWVALAGGGHFAIAQVPEISAPPGTITAYGGSDPPPGWLLANGDAVSRTQYAALFAVIQTKYGAGNGTTTFDLPDLAGRVVVGEDGVADRLSANENLGQSAGEEKHTLTVAELPEHTHGPGTLATNLAGSHGHGGSTGNDSPDHAHSGTTGTENQNHTHNTDRLHRPGVWVNAGTQIGIGPGGATDGINNAHTHPFTTNGASVRHAHSISSVGTEHSHTMDSGATGSAGSDNAHNTMPPYQIANYIIKT